MITLYRAATAQYGTLHITALSRDHACTPPLAHVLQRLQRHPDTPAGYARNIGTKLGAAWCRISYPDGHGVVYMHNGGICAWRGFAVDAAHYLPAVPAAHPCSRMHGHTFRIILYARTTAAVLRRACIPVHHALDRQCLNDLPGLQNPTSERLAHWIFERLPTHLHTAGVTVLETPTTGCHYSQSHAYRIWKHLRFEAAVHARYGHGYRLCLHLAAPLDPTMGWTLDYGDIPARFAPVLETLDHRDLGPAGADLPTLLHNIYTQAATRLPIHQLELYAGTHTGAVLTTTTPPFPAETAAPNA